VAGKGESLKKLETPTIARSAGSADAATTLTKSVKGLTEDTESAIIDSTNPVFSDTVFPYMGATWFTSRVITGTMPDRTRQPSLSRSSTSVHSTKLGKAFHTSLAIFTRKGFAYPSLQAEVVQKPPLLAASLRTTKPAITSALE
jgi:hypothetical protein